MRQVVTFLFCVVIASANGQALYIPAVAAGMGNNYFIAGTGDGGNLSTYNSFLRLHYGLAIGSPYVNNGSGGYVEKATISFDGRSGNISAIGNIGIGTAAPSAKLDIANTLQISERIRLSGQEFFQSGNGDSDGISFLLGVNRVGNRQLWIADSKSLTPNSSNTIIRFLVGGSQAPIINAVATDGVTNKNLLIQPSGGNVGIGTSNPTQKLTVNGTIYSTEVKVDLSVPGPDYVFEENYNLPSLTETENYIKQNKHLPEVPSACEMEENGINLSEMNMILLKKVEELTLYVIELKKENMEIKKLINEK